MRLSLVSGLTLLACFYLLVSSCTSSQSRFLDTDQFLTDVTVIDVVEGQAISGQTIVVREGRILEIAPVSDIKPPMPEQVLTTGGYVVPGLWDMHVHSMTEPDTALAYFFPLFLVNGVTGIRDMGSVVDRIVETRSRLDADPSILAPHLYVSGPLLDGQALPWYGDLPLVLRTPEDVNRELPKLQAAGMDFFKVYDALPSAAYDAVIAYGAANSIPVSGHAPKGVNLTGAGLAKQRTVEHLSPFGFRDCLSDPEGWFQRAINAKFGQGYQAYYTVTQELFDELDRGACHDAFKAMAAGGTRFTPTLVMELNDRSRVPVEDLAYLRPLGKDWCETGLSGIDQADPELRENVYAGYITLLNEMRSAGVTMIAGSDVPNNCLVPGFSLHWELARQVDAGFTPLEALQNATLNAADVMDRGDEVGQVASGYIADLVVVEANPLDDIANLRRINGVMTKGQWIGGETRQSMFERVDAVLIAEAKDLQDVTE